MARGFIVSSTTESSEFTRTNVASLALGIGDFGRRCKIRAPCCNEVFDCRLCHNEAKVICSLCETEQDQYCINCGMCMGECFCGTRRFFIDDHIIKEYSIFQTSKKQCHCNECGICRTGGRDNFFHCKSLMRRGCCYSKVMQDGHLCVERAMHHNCLVCFEYLIDTLRDITVLPC